MKKLFALIAMSFLLASHCARGEFLNTSGIPRLTNISYYEEAVQRLFNSNTPLELHRLRDVPYKAGGDRYRVNFEGQDWHVVIVSEDCWNCGDIDLGAEWRLKQTRAQAKSMLSFDGVDATMSLPDRAGLYTYNGRNYFIGSYHLPANPYDDQPHSGGPILPDYFERYGEAMRNPETIDSSHPLAVALTHYGRVMARIHLPTIPDSRSHARSFKKLLQRFAYFPFFTRGRAFGQFDGSGRFYLNDLAVYPKYAYRDKTVRAELMLMFEKILPYDTRRSPCASVSPCFTWLVDRITDGYVSALPTYSEATVRRLVRQTFVDAHKKYCWGEYCQRLEAYISNAYGLSPSSDLDQWTSNFRSGR